MRCLLLVLFLSVAVQAADVCIGPVATGNGSGSDWSNQTAWPATFNRANTHYLCDGAHGFMWLGSSIGGYTVNVVGSGTLVIKKATIADHGTSVGWVNTMGDGQATTIRLDIKVSNVLIDGQVGKWASDMDGYQAYGIKATVAPYPSGYLIAIGQGMTGGAGIVSNVTLKHIEATWNATTTGWEHGCWDLVAYANSLVTESCWFHNAGQNTAKLEDGTAWTIDSCVIEENGQAQYYMGDVGGNPSWVATPEHSVLVLLNAGQGHIQRNSVFRRFRASGGVLVEAGVNNGLCYGNVFTLGGPVTQFSGGGNGCLNGYGSGATSISGWRIFNNVFTDIATPVGYATAGGNICNIGNWLANNEFRNNLLNNVKGLAIGNIIRTHNWYFNNTGTDYTGDPNSQIGLAVPFVNSATYNYRLTGATSPGYTTGLPTADPDGNTRGADGVWDRGAFEVVNGAAPPGSFSFTVASASVAEDAGTYTGTVQRVGGSTGAANVTVTTSNGTATSGVNYTALNSTLAFADSETSKNFSVTILNASTYGNPTFTLTLSGPTGGTTLAAPSASTITINGVGSPPGPPVLTNLVWEAEIGQIAAPFQVSGGAVFQTVDTQSSAAAGGLLSFTFTNAPGIYRIKLLVKAELTYQNSLYIDFNVDPPASPLSICDINPVTSGYEWRYVSWRGSGTSEADEFLSKTFTLTALTNTLNIRGREALVYIDQVEVEVVPEPPPAPDPTPYVINVLTSATNGYYRAGSIVPITVVWSTNVTVTGTPTLTLTNSAIASYVSGSGTTNTVFNYTTGAGHDCPRLDYAATSSLALAGGTIKHGTTDADLTLTSPGAVGSLGYNAQLAIDTVAPTVSLGDPSISFTGGSDVSITATYGDIHLDQITLQKSDIVVTATGTATASYIVIDGLPGQKIIWLLSPTGKGTLKASLLGGTAFDLAGNLAPSAGPSKLINVDTTVPPPTTNTITVIIRNATLKNIQIGQ